MRLPTPSTLLAATKHALRGDVSLAVKSLGAPLEVAVDEIEWPQGMFPPVIINPMEHWTPDGESWLYTQDGGGHQYFKYVDTSSARAAYKFCPPVQAIINKKAQCYVNGKNWLLNEKEREVNSAEAKAIKKLFKNPNPLQTQKLFEAQMYIFMQVFGYSFLLFRKPDGFKDNIDAYNVWNIPPDMVDLEETKKLFYQTDLNGIIEEVVINYKDLKVPVKVRDLWIVRDFVPSFESMVLPSSRLEPLERNINNIIGALDTRGYMMRYRGALGILAQDPGASQGMGPLPMTPDEKKELERNILRYGTRSGQLRFIVTKAAMKWQQIGVPMSELMLFEEVVEDVRAICQGLNYPVRLFEIEPNNSLGGTDANIFTRNLYQDTIIPEAESIGEQLTAAFGLENVRIDKDYRHIPVLQSDKEAEARARHTLDQALLIEFNNNLLTWNEWQVALGKDPVPGKDLYYHQLAEAGLLGSADRALQVQTTAAAQNQEQENDNETNIAPAA